MNDIVLTFFDSLLRESDLEILRGDQWLNDTLISFYFEYLSNKKFPTEQDTILFVGPEVTHCLKATPADGLAMFLDPLHALEKELIFFALNDNRFYGQSGGTHWSLLGRYIPTTYLITITSIKVDLNGCILDVYF